MKFGDIISLAKAGFTPADIREFMQSTADETPEQEAGRPEEIEKGLLGDSVEKVDNLQDKDILDQSEAAGSVDYKKQYDELKAEFDKLKKSLQTVQADNTRKDLTGDKEDPQEIFSKVMAGFM